MLLGVRTRSSVCCERAGVVDVRALGSGAQRRRGRITRIERWVGAPDKPGARYPEIGCDLCRMVLFVTIGGVMSEEQEGDSGARFVLEGNEGCDQRRQRRHEDVRHGLCGE